MFEQEVGAEAQVELDLAGCRGEVEIIGHDAAQLRVVATEPTTEYQVTEEGKRFIVSAAGPIRIDLPRAASVQVIAAPRSVRVQGMAGPVSVSRMGGDEEWAGTAAASSAVARELSDMGRNLGVEMGKLGRDLGDQFGRTMSAWTKAQSEGPGQAARWTSRVEQFSRRAAERAEEFSRRAEERARRATDRAETRVGREAERAQQRVRRAEERASRKRGASRAPDAGHPEVELEAEAGSPAESRSALEERLSVLQLLQEGKISSAEAARLLEALEH